MTPRERVVAALDGREPDRLPVALGHYEAPPRRALPEGWSADEAVDVRFVSLPQAALERFRRTALPFRPDTRLGTTAQASTYARWRYRPERPRAQNPLARARSLKDITRFRFPRADDSPGALRALARSVESLHARGLAVGGTLPHLGGELFESAWRLRGLETFLLDLEERPAWADALLDRLAAFAAGHARALAGAGVDLVCLGDDVGMPGTMVMSPATWRRSFRPRMAQIIRAARASSPGVRVVYHSDGCIEPILGDLMEIGVDGVNPLQPEHMNAASIRARFGARLAFWGTVGTQTAFARWRPADIRREVALRIETIGRAGLVLAPAYDVDTPEIASANLVEFVRAARELG